MPLVEGSVKIAAPRQVVWDLLADPRRHTEFGKFVVAVTVVTEGEVREGTVYHERGGPGFMKSESDWEITTFDPPRKLIHTGKTGKEGSMAAEATWTLDEMDSRSTRVTQALDFKVMPGLRPLGRLVESVFARRMIQRETARMLLDLKGIAEASATPERG